MLPLCLFSLRQNEKKDSFILTCIEFNNLLKVHRKCCKDPFAKCRNNSAAALHFELCCSFQCNIMISTLRFRVKFPMKRKKRSSNCVLCDVTKTHRFACRHGAKGAEAVSVCDHHGRGETWRVGILRGLLFVRIHCKGNRDSSIFTVV